MSAGTPKQPVVSLRFRLGLDFTLCFVSEPSVLPFSTSEPFVAFSRLFFNAFSSIRMCLSIDSRSFLFVRRSPSSFPILDFISAFSICQAFRSRSCLCHSVCKKRITPVRIDVSFDGFQCCKRGMWLRVSTRVSRAHLEACILCPGTDCRSRRLRCCQRHFLRCPVPCLWSSAMPCVGAPTSHCRPVVYTPTFVNLHFGQRCRSTATTGLQLRLFTVAWKGCDVFGLEVCQDRDDRSALTESFVARIIQ